MKIRKVEFVISAFNFEQFPEDNKPEIAFVGRSNVGKSSLINKLLNRKKLAKTSSTPGKTKAINFFEVNESFRFVDLPGYGFAAVSKETKNQWPNLIENYLKKRKNLKCVIHIIDIRHEPTDLDELMCFWLKNNNIPALIAATKSDKLSKGRRKQHFENIISNLDLENSIGIVQFSAKTDEGAEKIWETLSSYLN